MSEVLQRSKTITCVQKETTGRRVVVVPGIVVGNPRAASFTKSLHLCVSVSCHVLRKEDFLDLPVYAGPLGASPGKVWLKLKRCRVSNGNFSSYCRIHHLQHFQINHKPSSATSFHGDPAALRQRQRQDEGRILWVLHENKRKKCPDCLNITAQDT